MESKEVIETAKAAQEIAKPTKAGIDNIENIERIGANIFGPIGEFWGLSADFIKHKRQEFNFRQKNRLKILKKLSNIHESEHFQSEKAIPLPSRISLEYGESLEKNDDEYLQDAWARLLFNTTNPDNRIEPRLCFKRILDNITSTDAKLLDLLVSVFDNDDFFFSFSNYQLNMGDIASVIRHTRPDKPYTKEEIIKIESILEKSDFATFEKSKWIQFKLPAEEIKISVDNLASNQLLFLYTRPPFAVTHGINFDEIQSKTSNKEAKLSDLRIIGKNISNTSYISHRTSPSAKLFHKVVSKF